MTDTRITKDSPYQDYTYTTSDFSPLGGDLIIQPGAYVNRVSSAFGTDIDSIYVQIGGGTESFDWTGSNNYVDLASTAFIRNGLSLYSRDAGNIVVNAGYIGGEIGGGLVLAAYSTTQSEYDAIGGSTVTNSGTIEVNRSEPALLVELGTVRNTGVITSGYAESGNLAVHLGMTISGITLMNRGSTLDNSGSIFGGVLFENGADTLDNSGTIRGAVNLGDGANTVDNEGTIRGTVTFGSYGDTLDNSGTIRGSIDLGAGYDDVVNSGTIGGALTLGTGGDFVDTTTGRITGTIDLGDGSDQFYGGNYADTVIGGKGSDTIELGGGNDTYFATAKDGEDSLDGGSGTDTYNLSMLAAGVVFDLGHADSAAFGYDEVTGFENIVGTSQVDTLTGTKGNNKIWSGAGADRLIGLAGNDTYYVETSSDVVVEKVDGGTDKVVATFSYTLAAGSEIELLVTAIPELTSTLLLKGNEFANTIVGNAGINLIYGMGGNDTLRGNGGSDTYYVDDAGDRVLENDGEGSDRVITSVSYTLTAGSSIETLSTNSITATTALKLKGNEFGNAITGNAGANTITGGLGADALDGKDGADRYVYNNIAESTSGSRDTITWGPGDKIDLFAIDANATLDGDQAFSFIGSAAFTAEGQLRAYTISSLPGTVIVEANTTGTSGAEMQFRVLTSGSIVGDDFIL